MHSRGSRWLCISLTVLFALLARVSFAAYLRGVINPPPHVPESKKYQPTQSRDGCLGAGYCLPNGRCRVLPNPLSHGSACFCDAPCEGHGTQCSCSKLNTISAKAAERKATIARLADVLTKDKHSRHALMGTGYRSDGDSDSPRSDGHDAEVKKVAEQLATHFEQWGIQPNGPTRLTRVTGREHEGPSKRKD